MQKDLSTSNSNGLAKFGIRCAVFFTPVVALLALATGSLYFAGELMPAAGVIAVQQHSRALYYPVGHPYSVLPQYKLAGATIQRREILVLGSSRANCMRSDFLRGPSDRFYNAAVWSAANIGFARLFLGRLPSNQLPRYVLLSIDPWWFYRDNPAQPGPDFFRSSTPLEIVDFSWRTGLWWLTQRQAYERLDTRIGILAKQMDCGLRPDGSFFAGPSLWAARSRNEKEQMEQVQNHNDPWFSKSSPGISAATLEEMRGLLDYCAARHIVIIGYISPLNPELYSTIRNDKLRAFNFQVGPKLASLFAQRGFPFFDFQNPAIPGCNADEYGDLVHETEVCSARNLLAMARQDRRMTALVDADKLQALLANRKSDWQLTF